jgi:chromosome segregation ATPase
MDYTFSLPTFLVVIIIVILFRTLDKRNRSLEKVKRFSDKLKEEISVFIKEKNLEINDIAVDLDLNLKKSREVLKRILTFEEALKAKEGDFKNMKSTVDSYAGTLGELVAMSGRVDENLKRIKEESVFIDRVGAQVKDISGRITRLESALETTLAKSTEKNKQELDKIRKKLLDSHRDGIEELEQNLHSVEQNMTTIADYVKKLEERKGEVVKTAEKAYRELLSNLDEEIVKRKKQGVSELSAEMNQVMEGANENQEKITIELRNMLESVQDTAKSLDEEFTAKIEDFKEQYAQIEKMFHEQLAKAAIRGENFNDEVFTQLKGSIEKRAKEQSREVGEYFNKVNADLDNKKKEIGELFGVLRSDANVWHVELNKQMKDLERQVAARLGELEHEVNTDMTDFLNRARDTQQSVSAEMEEFTRSVEGRLETYEEEVSYKFQKLESCNVDIETLEKSLRSYMGEITDKIKNDFTEVSRLMADERSAEKTKAEEELLVIRTEIENIESGVKALKAKAYENVSEKLQVLEDDFFSDFKERAEALRSQFEEFRHEISQRVESIKQENNETIESIAGEVLEQKEAELRGAIETKLDATQTEINEYIDSMLLAFKDGKAEVKQNFVQLEADFKRAKSMQEKVAGEIDEFTKDVEGRLGTYEQELAQKLKRLEACNADIKSLEKSLRTYMGEVTDKIKNEFAVFNMLLADERGAEKAKAAGEFENIRTEIENIESEVKELKAKTYQTVSEKLQVLEDDFINDFKGRSEALETRLAEFQEGVSRQIEAVKQENTENIESIAAEAFSEKEEEVRASIDSKLHATREKINEYIDSMVNTFEDRKAEVLENMQQLEADVKRDKTQLSAFFSGAKEEAEEWHEEILRKYSESEKEVTDRIAGLSEESSSTIETLKKNFSVRHKELEVMFESTFSTITKDFDEQKRDLVDSTNKEREGLKTELEKLAEKTSALGQGLDEIEKQQKNFAAQTKVFERADTLKIGLENDISAMRKELVKIGAYKKDMDAINKEFVTTKKLVDDVSAKVRDFVTEKKRINSMETDFKRLISISHEIDAKIVNITTNYDAVQELELKMRTLEELEKDVDTRYGRLEQKKKVLDSTTQGVDKNFQKLTNLDKSLSELQKEMKGIPALIKELKEEMSVIADNKEKTDLVVDKMAGIDNLILELEARMDKLNIAREWLARAETRLEQVNTQAQEQLRLLESLIKEETAQVKKERGAPSIDKRQTVVKLAHQGWSVQEIARATKLSRGEVELILELIPEK